MRRAIGDRLILATHNRGKAEELSRLLRTYPVKIVSAAALNLDEPSETEASFVGNARIKAQAAARATGITSLADDSGLEVDALDGAPGVNTADWAETPSGRNFETAMQRVQAALDQIRAPTPRRARFCCTLVLAWPDGKDVFYEGVVDGMLVWPPRGLEGHGFDPMFQPDGHSLTFGEMDRWKKNEISHRADAFRKFVQGCFT